MSENAMQPRSPMTIAFVNSSFGWGGGEVWLEQITSGLTSRGHAVLIVCRPDGAIARQARRFNAELIGLKFSWDFNPATIVRLHRILTSRHVDLICTNWEKELRLCGVAGWLANIPVVPSREVDRPIKSSLMNRLVYGRLARAIMLNSEATRATLLASAPWLAGKTSRVVLKGVTPELYEQAAPSGVRKELGIDHGEIVVGFVGRLDEQKGLPVLLEAMRMVCADESEIRFVLAGDGPLRARAAEYVRVHNLSGKVYLLGFREDVPSLMKTFDILIVPSQWEGFGYAALEAMAAGKPVIASDTSSLPEIVQDNVTGLLVPPNSALEFASAVTSLAFDRARQKAFGAAGRERACRMFPLGRMVEETEAFFADIVEGKATL